jgi:hypothetical protein
MHHVAPLAAFAFAATTACTVTTTADPAGGSDPSTVAPDPGPTTTAHPGGPTSGPALGLSCLDSGNHARETALPLTLGKPLATCLQGEGDAEYFQFAAPSSPSKGYATVAITSVAAQQEVDVYVYAAADNSTVQNVYTSTDGASAFLYFGTTPGATYRVMVKPFGGAHGPAAFTINAQTTGLADPAGHTRDAAVAIAEGVGVTGYFVGPYDGARSRDSWTNWYAVTLNGANARIELTNVASDILPEVYLYDATGSQIGDAYSDTKGADVVLTKNGLTPGQYFVSIQPLYLPSLDGGSATLPAFFTKPYTLRASSN